MNLTRHNNHAVARFVIVALLSALTISRANAAATSAVSATVSKSSVQVAEPFTLELTVNVPAGTRVIFPTTGDRIGDFDVVDRQDLFDIPGAVSSDLRQWTQRLTLESIITGELSVPSIEIQIADQNGSRAVRSDPIPIRVISVLEDRHDPTQFRDIQSVVDITVPQTQSNAPLWWAVGGISGFTCALALGMLISRRKQWLTPKQWALQQLDELGQEVNTESANTKLVSSELSNIIREYLQLQFDLPEAGRTLQELIDQIESRGYANAELINSLCALSTIADKAKFADLDLSPVGLKSLVAGSRQIVERLSSDSESQLPASKPTEGS